MILDNLSLSSTWLVVALTGLLLMLVRYVSPSLDALEPPVVKPRIPLVGHIISMIREGGGFYARLFKDRRLPICTLPMLNGKLYVINSPDLIQSALRNNDISFDPFLIGFSKSMWGLSDNAVNIISDKANLTAGLNIIHATLLGEPLHKLNVVALSRIMSYLNDIQPKTTVAVPDVFNWIRDTMIDATATGLFGDNNPLTLEHAHLLWTYDKQANWVALDVAPRFVVRDALNAREGINKLLLSYYQAGGEHGPRVSEIVRQRTKLLRGAGFDDDDLAHMELLLPWVGSTNTIPTSFWLFARVFTNPDYISRIRVEIESIAILKDTPEGKTATFDVRKLEKDCPFLNAVYQEILRYYAHPVGNRMVMEDTKIQDAEGNKYLLKKGVNVQWPPMVTQFTDTVWGQDADIFRPERFLDVSAQDEKLRRGAILAFGGGRHLCPGRKFAVAEILGLVGVITLGFEVEGLNLPDSTDAGVGVGLRPAHWGSQDRGFSLKRREGWEDVTWIFEE
ncbi:hypothetical protein FSARC_12133 [Fusarium sarcochroum]|uniref:Cytochrome P450 n=1 Tax=Fusarium sarcochroum TaxID=1208366 RepID=A0A8H4TAQ1_9HYPO|nr:hypothetical protein FSARC_12133 [Fusarium sarcochroum]